MLRRLAFFLGGSEDLHGAASLLDGLDRRFRRAMHLDVDLGLELTAAEQPHTGLDAAQHAGLHQRFSIDGRAGIDRIGVDRLLDTVEIDLGVFDPEHVVEAALGQAAMHRHLATFKTLDANARARGLALAAAARGLALARTDAAADAHALFARAGIVGDIAELHRPSPCFLRMIPKTLFGIMCRYFISRRRCERDDEPSRSCRAPPPYRAAR